MKQNTKLLHGYTVLDHILVLPAYQSIKRPRFIIQSCIVMSRSILYTRFSNPTIDALEDGLRCIENAKYALSFSSGMSAISNVLMFVECW